MTYFTTLDFDTLIILGLIIIVGLLTAEILRLNERLRRIFHGKTGEDMEEAIIEIIKTIKKQDNEIEEIHKKDNDLDSRLKKSIQRVNTIRFNPFHDQGGNQSFATSFLDENGDGVVISSLYSRDKVSVYAKPVAKHQSEYELSEEEKEAIKQ